MSRIIEYDPNFAAIPDGKVEEEYQELLSKIQCGENYYRIFGNESMFNRVRLGIVMGEIPCDSVEFCFHGEKVKLNEYGKLERWLEGFCDFNITMLEKLLKAAMKKYKESR